MEIKSNYSLSRLFVTKEINVYIDNKSFILILRPVKDFYLDSDWNGCYNIWTGSAKARKELLTTLNGESVSSYVLIKKIIFELGAYANFRKLYDTFKEQLEILLPQLKIDTAKKELIVNGITITEEIWEYIVYLLKLSNGEKVIKPPTFGSEEARQLYLAQKANEEKITSIKSRSNAGDDTGLSKIMLSITYAFPSFTFDYLYNQTMAQIQWLQKHAAGAVSYEVNAQAFAAGNVKKGKKLDFFIK